MSNLFCVASATNEKPVMIQLSLRDNDLTGALPWVETHGYIQATANAVDFLLDHPIPIKRRVYVG